MSGYTSARVQTALVFFQREILTFRKKTKESDFSSNVFTSVMCFTTDYDRKVLIFGWYFRFIWAIHYSLVLDDMSITQMSI
jgi:hypothetical protein